MTYMVKCDWCGKEEVALPKLDSNQEQTGEIMLPRGWWAVVDDWRKIHACRLECRNKLAAMREKGQQHD